MRRYKPAELFKGTAWYYTRYRSAYPAKVIAFLVDACHLDIHSRLLDLGSGPGNLAIPLSTHVDEVIAVDPDADMLDQGQRIARENGVENIRWILASSYDLSGLAIGEVNAATIGQAFHWMDREQTLRDLAHIVLPDGVVAIVGGPKRMGQTPDWSLVIEQRVQKWLGKERRAGSSIYQHPTERFEETLRRSEFSTVRVRKFVWQEERGLDEVVGQLFSTSYASPSLFGDRKDAFERELRSALVRVNPGGRFAERVQLEAIIARRPT